MTSAKPKSAYLFFCDDYYTEIHQRLGYQATDTNIKKEWFLEKKDKFESYGRDIESLLTHVKISHGRRLYGNDTEEKMINIDDLNNGYKRYLSHKKNEDKRYLQGLYV